LRILNQDLRDFDGFSGWMAASRGLMEWLALLLSESGFAGFWWIFGMDGGESGADGMVCFTAV